MNFFDLSPEATLQRIRASGRVAKPPSAVVMLIRGSVGFTILGVAGFLPWVLGLVRQLGEGGMYAVCAVVFIGLSGPLLHRLIIGPGSLIRFYKLFLVGFLAYAAIWCAFWFGTHLDKKDYLGLVVGCSAFAGIAAFAFGAPRQSLLAAAALGGLHLLGYWVGAILYAQQANWVGNDWLGTPLTKRQAATIARLLWGVFYGLGFGAGLGLALHICQTPLRTLMRTQPVADGGNAH